MGQKLRNFSGDNFPIPVFFSELNSITITRRKPKGDGGKGTGKKRHDNLRHVTTICDIL